MTVPIEQLDDAQKLDADAYVYFYEIQLYPTGKLYLCPTETRTWLGNVYQYWGLTMTGMGSSSDDQTNRPSFNLANFTYDVDGDPIRGVFSALNAQDKIEGATIIRRRVLKTHADANVDIKSEKRWKVARIANHTPDLITLELRNTLDGPVFMVPARKYLPPDFPQVSLQ